MKNYRQPAIFEAREDRAVAWFNSSARPVEKAEELLKRTRTKLVEFKRTGSRQALPELLADVTKLKSEIERIEEASSHK
jgi:hypothetical protein